ncbi:virion structural protein [Pseudomonas phage 20Sep418]|uniref:Tail tube protein n=2 Tax=Pakpunavirus TaxID=1921407 RepID=A0A411BDT4_9CAUD|nr:hypothetical protein QE326_gp062 [Pseudomonas phage PaZq-1]QAX99808.1 hypothetical protein [Pseudomonas phage PaZq-1]QAY01715.1 hypothetical protein PaSzw1_161 [Pseudomonas phage PaSzW-1]WFG37186.1 capsid protein [Pseudomonas phage bmx-p3]WFG37700.1 virion structural protein [Pseudomonas phage 20Sep418]
MANTVLTYSPSDVKIVLCGYALTGVVSFEMSWLSRPYTMVRGIRGHHTRVFNRDLSAQIRIEVLQTSVSNDALFSLVEQDRRTQSARITLSVKDTHGSTMMSTDNAYVNGYPSITFTDGIENRVWTIDVLDWTDGTVGGNQQVGFDVFGTVQGALSYLR